MLALPSTVPVERLAELGGRLKTVPTVLFPDGSTLTNPSLAQVKAKISA